MSHANKTGEKPTWRGGCHQQQFRKNQIVEKDHNATSEQLEEETQARDTVINISSVNLMDTQTKVLTKGLFTTLVKNDIITLKNNVIDSIKHPNITREEINALQELSKNDRITVKPANKGGAIVIMTTIKYIQEIRSQLYETSVYVRLNGDPHMVHKRKNRQMFDTSFI